MKRPPRHDIFYKYQIAFSMLKKYARGKRCLDLGCSYGMLEAMLGDSYDITGIDRDAGRIGKARKLANAKFYVMAVDKFKFKQRFDVIFALDIIEHLLEPEGCIRSIREHLKKDGIVIVSLPNRFSFWNILNNIFKLEQHYHYWSPRGFEKLMEKNGFRLVEMEPRQFFGEGIGFIPGYKKIFKLDAWLGGALPQICAGWVFTFKKR